MNAQQNVPAGELQTMFHVLHETRVNYQRRVTLSQQFLHLTPRVFSSQNVMAHQIDIDPAPNEVFHRIDYFGNASSGVTISTPHQQLMVAARFTVGLLPRLNRALVAESLPWEVMRDNLRDIDRVSSLEPAQFLFESPHVVCSVDLADYAATSFAPGRPLLDAALDLTERIYKDFEFDDEATTISTPLAEVLKGKRGVCQDFAHLMIGCLRSIGIACRYVSGYILTMPPPGQPRLVGADASHAWVSVFCPGFGWVDFDPTNGCLVQSEHITLGWGRDFSDVTPMRGVVLGGGEQEVKVSVTVSPLMI
ncbi:transglutaminase family protein [soil metagenome]